MAGRQIDLTDEWDRQKLRNWMDNARNMKREDVYRDAFRQLCRTDGREMEDPLESDYAGVRRALEEALADETGKPKRLNRPPAKVTRPSLMKTLAEMALKKTPSIAFLKLAEYEMVELSGEALIVKYKDEFAPDVVSAARQRLTEFNVELEDA